MSVGGRIERTEDIRAIMESGRFSGYGVRQLPDALAERVRKELQEYGTLLDKTRNQVNTYAPLPTEEITKPKSAVRGTGFNIFPTVDNLVGETDESRKLDLVLDEELLKLFKSRYSMYG